MNPAFSSVKVLITVMTYPHPSKSHQELVCTAGITEQSKWVRLYPIDYRYMPAKQQFRKYQWIEIGLADQGAGNDDRRESRRPDLKSVRVLEEPLPTTHNWRARREIIDGMPHHTTLELEELYEKDRTSLGIVRPSEVLDLEVEQVEREWKPKWQTALKQFHIFSGPPKQLEKLPYKFSYVFRCADSADKIHRAMIEDRELGVLYRKEVERLGDEQAAVDSVRKQFLDKMCSPSRDTCFFMGTVFPYNTGVVIGVFWPAKDVQKSLFQ